MNESTTKALDALQIAIKLEIDSINYYQDATQKTKNDMGRATFASLAKEELGHIDIVKKAYATISEMNSWDAVAKLIPEKIDESKKTIFQTLKQELQQKIKPDIDDMKALQIAMDIENTGYKFYEKSAQETIDPIGKKLFEFLKGEENRHWDLLRNTYEYLSDPGLWFAKEEKHIYDGG